MDQKYSDKEYQEIEKLIPGQVKQIREILRDGKVVPSENCEDEFLARCLRLKDGNVEEAVRLIKTFHATVLNFHTSWKANFQPSLFQEFYNSGSIVPLINRDSSGHLIIFVRSALWNPDEMNFDQLIVCLWMIVQYAMVEMKDVQRNGFIVVWDDANFSLKQAWHINNWRLLSLPRWIQNGVLGRMKEFHGMNQPKALRIIFQAVRPFMKEKLKKRITFHDSIDSLLKKVDRNCLPGLVGGSLEEPDKYIDRALLLKFFSSDQYFQGKRKKILQPVGFS